MEKIIAISDLHGHYTELMDLMDKLKKEGVNFKKDTLVFLGDYVDGGPDVKKVLDQLMDWHKIYPHWVYLFGNHESLLLDAFNPKHPIYGDFYLWYRQGGKETTDSFITDDLSDYDRALVNPQDIITDKYTDFLRELPLFYETDKYFFVHGGLYPNRTIEKHIEAVGDTFHPDLMEEGDMGYDMIWMRDPFISSKYDWGKKIVFGHTIFPYNDSLGTNIETGKTTRHLGYPLIMDNKLGLDTFRHNDGRLTAVILPEEKFVFSHWSGEL